MMDQLQEEVEVNTSTRAPLIAGGLLFAILFAGMGIWMFTTQLASAVIASGTITVAGKPKTVQHLDGGIITDIVVEDGDIVEAGDLLIRVDDTLLLSNLEIYENRILEAIGRRQRLLSERDQRGRIVWDDRANEAIGLEPDFAIRAGQDKLFRARRQTRLGQLDQLEEQIAQLQNQLRGMSDVGRSQSEQMRLLQEEHDGLAELSAQGYAASNRVLTLQRQLEEMNGQAAQGQSEMARVENSITETRIQMLQVDREFQQSVLTELREVEGAINDLTQQLQATREQLGRVEIVAPVGGVVHQLSIFTIGGVIAPGGAVMEIVPQSEQLEILVDLEPQYIDQVYIDQPADVLFSAFNTRTTPNLNGKVLGVSPDSVLNEQLGVAFYKVQVGVSDKELQRLNGQQLIPGMPVEVFMQTKPQTPWAYLTKPLSDNIKRAFKEE